MSEWVDPDSFQLSRGPTGEGLLARLPSAEEVTATPTEELPALIRSVSETVFKIETLWRKAYDKYREDRGSLTTYYHREQHIHVKGARGKAMNTPEIKGLSKKSLELKKILEQARMVEKHANQEYEVRVKKTRTEPGRLLSGNPSCPPGVSDSG